MMKFLAAFLEREVCRKIPVQAGPCLSIDGASAGSEARGIREECVRPCRYSAGIR